MLPGILSGGIIQINILIDTIFASLLQTGSPTWLYLSDRLIQLPLGIFAIAAATVILPALSNAAALKNDLEFNEKFNWALKFILDHLWPNGFKYRIDKPRLSKIQSSPPSWRATLLQHKYNHVLPSLSSNFTRVTFNEKEKNKSFLFLNKNINKNF